MVTAKRLGLAGLVLAGVLTVLSPRVYAKNVEGVKTESESTSPQIIATFESESHRPEPEYKGKVFRYYLWSDGRISQANPNLRPDSVVEPETRFASRWFYDIDGDGEFGKAELDWIKLGRLVYMHPEFNKIANAEIRKAFGSVEQKTEPKKIEIPEKEKVISKESEREKEKRKDKNLISIIAGVRGNYPGVLGSNGLYGGELGVKYEKFALVGNVSGRPDRNVKSIEEELINNVYFQGREDLKDFFSVGASLEYHQPILPWLGGVFGVGGNIENYTREGEAKLVKRTDQGDLVINSNTQSFSEREFVGSVYAGPSFKITDWLRLNPNIGYEAVFKEKKLEEGGAYKELKGRGAYVSLRAIISVPNKYKRNR